MNSISKVIESLSARYKNFILIGDFNAEESDTIIKDFCDICSFKNLIKDTTCFKNSGNPKIIDPMLTNRNKHIQTSCVTDTGFFDFHKMTVNILISHLNKLGPQITHYRDYKSISNDEFRSELVIENNNLQNQNDLDLF